MDFTLDETQRAVARLAAEVLDRSGPPVPRAPARVPPPAPPTVPPIGPGDGDGDGMDTTRRYGKSSARHAPTAELMRWLDIQVKRNTVLTFGGGVNEVQRELIATAGLGLPRVPR